MYSIKNVVERLGNAEHEYGAVHFLMSSFPNLFRKLHQISFNKRVYIAIHDGIDVRCLIIGTVVLDASVIEDIGAYLASPFDLLLTGFHLGSRLTTFLQFQFV